jgi:hypothetical protein
VIVYAVYIGGEVPDDGLGGGCTAAYAGQTRPGSAILGALLAVVVNLAHGDLPADPEAALGRVAADASWGVLHLGIMASVLLILFGLVGLSQMAERPLAQTLARLSLVAALPAAGVMLAGIAVDGFATKTLADLWANAVGPDKAAAFQLALTAETIQNALFHTWAALFLGLPFVLMGISGVLTGGGFPRWLGSVALIGGVGALCTGVSGFLDVPAPGVLFNVFAFVVTLWLLIAGVTAAAA